MPLGHRSDALVQGNGDEALLRGPHGEALQKRKVL